MSSDAEESPRQTKAARTRRRILSAAAAEFAEHGYAGTSLRRVADGSGLQLGSLYFHFASKDELLAEVVRDAVAFAQHRVAEALRGLDPSPSAGARFAICVRAHLGALHDSRARGAAVARIIDATPALVAAGARRHVRPYARFWTSLVSDAQDQNAIRSDLDPVLVRDLLIGAMNATVGPTQLRPPQVDRLADTLLGLVLTDQASTNPPDSGTAADV